MSIGARTASLDLHTVCYRCLGANRRRAFLLVVGAWQVIGHGHCRWLLVLGK